MKRFFPTYEIKEDNPEGLLQNCIESDVWSIVQQMFTIVDMLVMCLVSIDMRVFFKGIVGNIGGISLYYLVSCKSCGNKSYQHWCRSFYHNPLNYTSCKTGNDVVRLKSVGPCTYDVMRINAIKFSHIDDNRVIYINILCEGRVYPNWSQGHTISCDSFQLRVQLDNQKGDIYYLYDDDSTYFLANGLHQAMLVSSKEVKEAESVVQSCLIRPIIHIVV